MLYTDTKCVQPTDTSRNSGNTKKSVANTGSNIFEKSVAAFSKAYTAAFSDVVGSSSDVKEKLEELHESVGGFGVLLAMGHEWQPAKFWESSMGMLVDEVIAKI